MPHTPRPEVDYTSDWTLLVPEFGHPDSERDRRDTALRLLRAMHTTFGEGVSIVDSRGVTWTYDALADDGHHDGHTEPLVAAGTPMPEAIAAITNGHDQRSWFERRFRRP